MKRILLLLLILLSITLFAQSKKDEKNMRQIIGALNRGAYNLVTSKLNQCDNWNFRPKKYNDFIDVENGLEFVDYIANSQQSKTNQLDSFLAYIAKECQTFVNYYYDNEDYIYAIPYAGLRLNIDGVRLGEDHPDYITSLKNIGLLYLEIENYSQAEKYYLSAYELCKSLWGMNHVEYASSLHYLGIVYANIGDYIKAWQCYHSAGAVYSNIEGYYSQAEESYLESIYIYHRFIGISDTNYAELLHALGCLYAKNQYIIQAKECFLESFEIYKSIPNQESFSYVGLLSDMGGIYIELHEYSKAEEYLLEALKIRQSVSGTNHPDFIALLNNIGNLYCEIGNYFKAEEYLLESLEICQTILGTNHPDCIALLNSIGYLYENMGNYFKAEEYLLESLNIAESIWGKNTLHYANILSRLGSLYYIWNKEEQGMRFHYEAMNIREAVLGINHPDYASSLYSIGLGYVFSKNDTMAEHFFKKALKIREITLGTSHPSYLTSLYSLGSLLSKKDYIQAEGYYLKALEIEENILRESQISDYIFLNLVMLYIDLESYDQAEQYFYKATQTFHTDYLQASNFMSEKERYMYLESLQNLFCSSFPTIAYAFHIKKPFVATTFAYNNELFLKGLLLNSSKSVKRSILESNDTVLINQWNELTTKKQQIQVLQEKQPQSDYLKQIQEEAELLEKQITQSSAAYRENQAMWQITWDSVRNQLSPNEVSIEYFSAPLSEDSTMYCALLLRHDSEYPKLIPLFEEKEITSFLSAESGNITNKTYDFYANGGTISQLVWSKILPKLKEGETIYFAPSGLLHQLAIEYLPYDENRTMSDVYNMVRLSSTREIVTNKSQAEYTTATIYGGIQYDLDADNLLAESERYAKEDLLASRGIENDTLNRDHVQYLPGTKKEAESINLLLKQNNISAKLYTTAKANEESFKALSGKHSNILHIGTHGFTWTDSVAKKQDYFSQRMRMQMLSEDKHHDTSIDPLNRCGLLFAGANIALQGNSKNLPEGVQDGILTATEISLMDLRDANLVVLSACETAKGDITSEGVFGLQRAFKMAGVQTIIMSLWKVNDQATQLLMTEFYNNWIGKHQSKREAFRNAQNSVRTRYEEPEYWAGFIMLD